MKIDKLSNKEFKLKILSALQELKEYRIAKDEDRLMVLKPKEEAEIHIISTCLEACKVEVIENIFDDFEPMYVQNE